MGNIAGWARGASGRMPHLEPKLDSEEYRIKYSLELIGCHGWAQYPPN